ncbi:P-loop NTPase fold protein [Leptothrix sp. BB-4]
MLREALPALKADGITTGITTGITLLTTTLGLLATWMNRLLQPMKTALSTIERAQVAVEAAVDQRLQTAKAAREAAREKLEAVEARIEQARQQLSAASTDLAAATAAFSGETPAGRLIRFVRARASDGHYARHLGLIATIRKDFEQLSADLQAQQREVAEATTEAPPPPDALARFLQDHGADLPADVRDALQALAAGPTAPAPPFQRVILYIDDLDRCAPDKVVEVLQAVHMLLAFRLFVVFVAVDVRWIDQALRQQYGGLMTEPGGATSADYLEKIFQIPFWLPALDENKSGKYLRSILPKAGPEPEVAVLPETAASWREAGPPVVATVTEVDVRLSMREEQTMLLFVPLVGGSPRKILRYVNVYRLIKARGFLDSLAWFPAVPEHAILANLALAIADPAHFERWIELLNQRSDDSLRDLTAAAIRLGAEIEDRTERHLKALKSYFEGLDSPELFEPALAELRRCAPIARRYSFTT